MVQGGRGRGADITPEHPAESIGRVGADGGGPLSTRTHGWWECAAGSCDRQGEWYRRGRYVAPLSLDGDKGAFILRTKHFR